MTVFRPGRTHVSIWRAALPLIALCCGPGAHAAEADNALPALEILWDGGNGKLEWRTFDAAGNQASPSPRERNVSPDKKVCLPDKKVCLPDKKVCLPDKKVVLPDKKVVLSAKKVVLPDKKVALSAKKVSLPAKKVSLPDKKVSLLAGNVAPPGQNKDNRKPGEDPLPDPHAARAPLGSLWKLFVYLWLREERHPAPDYVCTGARGASAAAREHRAEEAYCCAPGQGIGRDAALLRSCGLFFSPARLGIDPSAWRRFWEARPGVREHAPWLADSGAMKPETVVSPASILAALAAAPTRAREDAANVLLARLFNAGTAPTPTALVQGTGSQLRIKTFSWHRPGKPGTRYGGGAGWLGNGRPVWFAGEGTGQQVMSRHGATLAAALSGTLSPENTAPAPGCVKVNFFARYPFTLEQAGGKPAPTGILHGRYAARFRNGVSIPVTANGELHLTREHDGRERLEGRFGLDDYVARVIEREADATQTEAARALAVVIRSYLLNEAKKQGNCLAIDDSSRTQRVSPNPPGPAARAAAGFSAGLRLVGVPVTYHSHTPSKNRMAWTEAVAASRAGEAWDILLRKAFPDADLTAMHDPAGLPCQPFAEAETWLAARAPQWHRILQERLRGFAPPAAPRVCLLPYGTPFSEQDRNRIHVRGLRTVEDRLALAHEYLHLGLRHHPSGHDEELIERWARALTLGDPHETALFR